MKQLNKYFTATLLISTLLLSGCTQKEEVVYGDNTNSSTSSEDHLFDYNLNLITPHAYDNAQGLELPEQSVISMIVPDKNIPFWNTVKTGALKAIQDINTELGFTGKNSITLSFNSLNTVNDVSEQINILDLELATYPLALAIAPVDSTAFEMQFDQALENGIPIITLYTNSQSNNTSAFVGTDLTKASQDLIDELAFAMDTNGEYAILSTDANEIHNLEKINAAKEYIEENHPNMTLSTVFDIAHINSFKEEILDLKNETFALEEETLASTEKEDLSTSNVYDYSSINFEEVFHYILENNPDIKGLYVTDKNATQKVLDVLDENSPIQIVSFNSSSQLLTAVEEERICALAITNPYGLGYASIIASCRGALDVGNEAMIETGYTIINKDNYNDNIYQDIYYHTNE